ncbi:hypothetical protein HOLleu_19930 [Holothuria leucospilota]|uniref:Uncharacterized protein n=1 Tax=Holothuria leucospilota TaxID=206669 RepID=A0A9Q1C0T7_HOLLE|nr:hypothetical protein HOLleu_19930 [Holothuria leucospilota]
MTNRQGIQQQRHLPCITLPENISAIVVSSQVLINQILVTSGSCRLDHVASPWLYTGLVSPDHGC